MQSFNERERPISTACANRALQIVWNSGGIFQTRERSIELLSAAARTAENCEAERTSVLDLPLIARLQAYSLMHPDDTMVG